MTPRRIPFLQYSTRWLWSPWRSRMLVPGDPDSIRRRRTSWWRAVLAPAAVLLLLTSCSGGQDGSNDAVRGGTLVVGVTSDPKSLNPLVASSVQASDIIDRLFIKLLEEQPDFLSFEPRLARRWDFSDDSLSITFHLRDDVLWHDGKPVTAQDVLFTWQLQTDDDVAWSGAWIKDRINDVTVIDDQTVTFHYDSRYPYQLMDANDGVILPRHILSAIPRDSIRTSPFGRQPVGNGPFRLGRWVSGQLVELVRNDDYYESGEPYLDRVIFRIVPDVPALVTQLKTGEIDCLEGLSIDARDELRAGYPQMRIHEYPSRHMVFVAWNVEDELLHDRRVRRALAMAIDGREIIKTLWRGAAQPCKGPMHPLLWAYDPTIDPVPYDPTRAAALLDSLGWRDDDGDGVRERDGRRFEFNMMTNTGVPIRADVMTMVQEYLRRIDVKVNTRTLEWNTFIAQFSADDFQSCVMGIKTPTRVDLTRYWRSTAAPPNGFNLSRYANPEVDELIDRAKRLPTAEEARPLWIRAQRQIYADQPMFFLAVPNEIVALRDAFCDVQPNAISFFYNIREWIPGEDCPR